MQLNNPWEKLYKNWPARNEIEAMALKLLAEAKADRIMEETGMNHEEYLSFMKWAREYETNHLCVSGPRRASDG